MTNTQITFPWIFKGARCWRASIMGPSSCSKSHRVFTARQRFRSPCENDSFSFVIDHSQPNRKTNEANTRPVEIRCRSHSVSNEREDERTARQPAITGHGFAWKWKKKKKKLFSPFGGLSLSLFRFSVAHDSQFSAAIDGWAYLNMKQWWL